MGVSQNVAATDSRGATDIVAGGGGVSSVYSKPSFPNVHDELVFEVPTDRIETIRMAVEGCMVAAAQSVLGSAIPVVVETSIGDMWDGQ